MAAISFSGSRGKSFFAYSDFTVGTSAPGTGDMEVRYNTTDANTATMTREDIILFLKAVIRALEQGQQNTNAPPL